MLSFARLRFAITILLAMLLARPVLSASPRDELLRFVPEDVGFCLVIQNVRDQAAALDASPFAVQFRASAAGKALQNDANVKLLVGLETKFKELFGLGWAGLRDDLLGDAVVFAYRPGKPGQEQFLVLIRARTEKVLTDVLSTLDRRQKETGDLEKLEERTHKGIVYFRRVEKQKEAFYAQRGPILIYSPDEALLRKALELGTTANADTEPALTAALRQLGADKALFAFFINARAFDADFNAKAAKSEGADGAFLKTFLIYWKALDGLCISLTLDRDATLALGMRGRSESLPPAARRLFGELAKPADLWQQFPDTALLSIAGRIDFKALAEVAGEFLTADNRQALHKDLNRFLINSMGKKDVVNDVLPFLGPETGLVLTTPADPKHPFPAGLFALQVRSGDKAAPVDVALLNQLNFFANLAIFGHAQQFPDQPLELKVTPLDKSEVKYLASSALPPGVQPAFALKNGFLLLAGSPDWIRRFAGPSSRPAADGSVPLARASFKAWRGYIQARRMVLARTIAEKEHVTEDVAGERLNSALDVLAFLDQLDVRLQTGKGQTIVSIVIRPAQPLRK